MIILYDFPIHYRGGIACFSIFQPSLMERINYIACLGYIRCAMTGQKDTLSLLFQCLQQGMNVCNAILVQPVKGPSRMRI